MEEAIFELLEWAPKNAIFVFWSDSDKFQIRHEIEGKSIDIVGMDDVFENWLDDNGENICESKIGELFPWLASIECTA